MPKRLAKGKHLVFLKLKPGAIPLVEATISGQQAYAAPTMEKASARGQPVTFHVSRTEFPHMTCASTDLLDPWVDSSHTCTGPPDAGDQRAQPL